MQHDPLPKNGTRAAGSTSADLSILSHPDWHNRYPLSPIEYPRNSEFVPLSIAHYANAAERAPEEVRNNPGAFATWRVERDPDFRRVVELSNSWRRSPAEAREHFRRFAISISPSEGQALIDKVGNIGSPDGSEEMMVRFPANTHYQTIAAYDSRWMPHLYADQYTFSMLRREDPATFVNPHLSPDPIGVLLRQGYTPTVWPRDNDVVLYCSQQENAPYVRAEHWGVVRGNGVISKVTAGNVALHNLAAVGFPEQSVFFFTKPFDANAPVPDLYGITDWGVRRGAVVSREAEAAGDKLLERAIEARELEFVAASRPW